MDDFKKMFHSQEDFNTRLNRTILKYKDEFYYAQTRDENSCLKLIDLVTSATVHRSINVDEELEAFFFGAATLGLVNIDGGTYSVERAPARRYKAGTPPEYLTFREVRSERDANEIGKGRGCFTEGFYNMLHNRYPNVGDAIKMVQANPKSTVAVSRTLFFEINDIGVPVLVHRNKQPLLWIGPSKTINMTNSNIARIATKGSESMILKVIQKIEDSLHSL